MHLVCRIKPHRLRGWREYAVDSDTQVADRNPKNALMFIHKHILHFRLLAKYVAAFFTMASSSARSANCRFRRAISAAWLCSKSL